MQFFDKITIEISSGKWGDGCVAGRREAGVAYWWPSWGNWWKWWSIILQSDKNLNTLIQFKYNKKFSALEGEAWRTKEQYGANAEDLILKVPVWVSVFDEETKKMIYYFSEDKEEFVVANWWKWWLWNMEFTTSTLQFPTFAILWEPWHIKSITLELQLLWDVALIGTPSVWKSTLINAISNTKAKVADYHFTTLVPHLWSVKFDDYSFNVVDIPGLIKGAAKWKWLGNDFLRHVLKAKIFCVMWDLYALDNGMTDMIELLEELREYLLSRLEQKIALEKEWDINLEINVNNSSWKLIVEVKDWDELIFQRLLLFIFNKQDLLPDEEIITEYLEEFIDKIQKLGSVSLGWKKIFAKIKKDILHQNCFIISAATHHNIRELLNFFAEELETLDLKNLEYAQEKTTYLIPNTPKKTTINNITETEKETLIENNYLEDIDAEYVGIRQIDDPRIAELVYTTQWWNDEAEMHFWDKMDIETYLDMFKDAWIVKWDILKIKSHYSGYEDRYVQW